MFDRPFIQELTFQRDGTGSTLPTSTALTTRLPGFRAGRNRLRLAHLSCPVRSLPRSAASPRIRIRMMRLPESSRRCRRARRSESRVGSSRAYPVAAGDVFWMLTAFPPRSAVDRTPRTRRSRSSLICSCRSSVSPVTACSSALWRRAPRSGTTTLARRSRKRSAISKKSRSCSTRASARTRGAPNSSCGRTGSFPSSSRPWFSRIGLFCAVELWCVHGCVLR